MNKQFCPLLLELCLNKSYFDYHIYIPEREINLKNVTENDLNYMLYQIY